jgi:hypothetical protein
MNNAKRINNTTQDLRVEECRKALKSCPHDHGTVKAICRVCLDRQSFMAWANDDARFVIIDCPRCTSETGDNGGEVCPCLEDFGQEAIAKAIESLRADQQEDDAKEGANNSGQRQGVKDEFTPLCHALKWLQPRYEPAVPLTGQSAIDPLAHLRAWAEEHKEVRIPHPKATLLLHLLDRGMIEFASVPETGKPVLRAKNAKEEFSRFLAQLNRTYQHDEMTIRGLLCFAYGQVNWELDPAALQCYERGSDTTEIYTSGFDVQGGGGILRGNPEEIERIVRNAYGCVEAIKD